MNEWELMRLMGGGSQTSGIDMTSLVALLTIAVIYFLAPVVGYRFQRPAGIVAALYILVGTTGVSVLQAIMQWLQWLDNGPGFGGGFGGGPRGRDLTFMQILFLVGILKSLAFLLALVFFVVGLQSMRLRPQQEIQPQHDER